jgi:hypothetical protein
MLSRFNFADICMSIKSPSAIVFGLHEFLPSFTLCVPHLFSNITVFIAHCPHSNTSAEMIGRFSKVRRNYSNVLEKVKDM